MTIRYRLKSLLYAYFWTPKEVRPPPYRHIVQVGDPILRYKSDPVPVETIKSAEICRIIQYMKVALNLYDIAGLSAPQLGVGKRIMGIQFPKQEDSEYDAKKYEAFEMSELPLQFWINPEMRIVDWDKVSHPEGCASLRGFCADVPRYKKVALKGYNEEGEEKTLEASGWIARIIQHEMDHLNGNFYTDQMEPKTFCNTGWQYINLMEGRVKLSYGPHY